MPATLETLRRRHPEYGQNVAHWSLLEAMVAGGHQMTLEKKLEILPNPDGRPTEVIQERGKLAPYTNKIGPILSRLNSQLFNKKPIFSGSTDPFWDERFFESGGLLDRDDDARASFTTFLENATLKALTTGKAIAQIDTRIASLDAVSRSDQATNGELEPYVVLHPRSALWDWEPDSQGFLFAKLHQFRMRRQRWDEAAVPEHDFTIYQRDGSTVLVSRYLLRKRMEGNKQPPTAALNLDTLEDKDVEILVYPGPGGQPLENLPVFSFRGRSAFPIVTLTVPDQLCVADQLFELQKSYFTQTAGVEYALYTNNCAIPVINGVEDEDEDPLQTQKIGEGYYLTLRPGQSISTFERSGTTIATAINYRSEIKRDIYDQLQQIALSAADGVAIVARSAQSKREDRRPEQILLETYGQLIKEFGLQILAVAAIAHAEAVTWKCDGLEDFLGEGILEEIADVQGLQQLQIPSPTFRRATAKFLTRRAGRSMGFDSQAIEASLKELDQAKDEEFSPPQPPQLPPEGVA